MIKLSDIVYVGIRLTPKSRKKLIEEFMKQVSDDRFLNYYRIFADHITVGYGDAVTLEMVGKIGSVKKIKHAGFIFDDLVSYLPVQVKGVPNAHITMGVAGRLPPVVSLAHLQQFPLPADTVFKDGFGLEGKMVAYLKDGRVIDSLEPPKQIPVKKVTKRLPLKKSEIAKK